MSGHTTIQTLHGEASAGLREHILAGQFTAIRDHDGVRYAVKAQPRPNRAMPRFTYFIDGKRVAFAKFSDAVAAARVTS